MDRAYAREELQPAIRAEAKVASAFIPRQSKVGRHLWGIDPFGIPLEGGPLARPPTPERVNARRTAHVWVAFVVPPIGRTAMHQKAWDQVWPVVGGVIVLALALTGRGSSRPDSGAADNPIRVAEGTIPGTQPASKPRRSRIRPTHPVRPNAPRSRFALRGVRTFRALPQHLPLAVCWGLGPGLQTWSPGADAHGKERGPMLVAEHMKTCPFCAEAIQEQATVCRYCSSPQPQGLVTIHERGINHALGTDTRGQFAVWDLRSGKWLGGWSTTQEGWKAAWSRYSSMEPRQRGAAPSRATGERIELSRVEEVFAVLGIAAGFLVLLTIPGWYGVRAWRRYRQGQQSSIRGYSIFGMVAAALVVVSVAISVVQGR